MHKAAEEVANIPIPVYVFLFITILLAMILFFQATRSRLFLTLSLVWIIIQAIIGTTGIYHNATMVPPPLLLFGMLPMILFIVWILSSSMGKQWIARCDLQWLTFFHAIRILVEGVLLLLYQSGSMS
ncbi:MAG TPA: hypothetical protein PLP34_06290, partial [Chitinophagaceae bacterium]|nr:hypothetical protein [Chitinophagaceae bacterium]